MLEIAYIALSLVMTLILIVIGFYSLNNSEISNELRKKNKKRIVAGLLGWHIYVFLISESGLLHTFSFPPRFALFLIVPLFIFTGVFIYKNRNSEWVKVIPKHWLAIYQSFRIFIETIFVYSVAAGILNYHVTIEGYNYDMVFAYTAPIIGYLLYKKDDLSPKIVLIWNYLGLAIIASIIFLFLSSVYNPSIFGEAEILLPIEITKYPYSLVPGFLMPSAVFIHVLSIAKYRNLLK